MKWRYTLRRLFRKFSFCSNNLMFDVHNARCFHYRPKPKATATGGKFIRTLILFDWIFDHDQLSAVILTLRTSVRCSPPPPPPPTPCIYPSPPPRPPKPRARPSPRKWRVGANLSVPQRQRQSQSGQTKVKTILIKWTIIPGASFMNRRRLCQLTAAILTSD